MLMPNTTSPVSAQGKKFNFNCFPALHFPIDEKVAQLAITCSKLMIETLKQGVKYVQTYVQYMFNTPMALLWCL